ncbi:MJ0042-type zinc finger domain-containing protein, partial [Phenylobacterium sp.]|nr:zinc-ribbon domain-containing protein [Phenylobacterium sp.]
MILTCPNCTARYAVKANSIPAEGRNVRCVSCNHKWIAYPEDSQVEPSRGASAGPPPPPPP